MSKIKTLGDIFTKLDSDHKEAHDEIYHMILHPIVDPFTDYFKRSQMEPKKRTSFADSIARQILSRTPTQSYLFARDFMSDISDEAIKKFNQHNELFTILRKDPRDTGRTVNVTLKQFALNFINNLTLI